MIGNFEMLFVLSTSLVHFERHSQRFDDRQLAITYKHDPIKVQNSHMAPSQLNYIIFFLLCCITMLLFLNDEVFRADFLTVAGRDFSWSLPLELPADRNNFHLPSIHFHLVYIVQHLTSISLSFHRYMYFKILSLSEFPGVV